ncbi:hemagglutinin repeat-containing protein [Pleomorphomonas oryzae]|uniref:hemagglutinin repeat-containing protein n=1 Tax=Pleomorphomonas oryzae TaxID=261934 RepID=UPI000A0269C3|nr:hemagglutinin repeat-containing protein [Pleomorphomonas oryzae]
MKYTSLEEPSGRSVGKSESVSANAAYSNSKTAATSSQELDSHVTCTGTVALNSGNDTSLKGVVVTGETVIANVGAILPSKAGRMPPAIARRARRCRAASRRAASRSAPIAAR